MVVYRIGMYDLINALSYQTKTVDNNTRVVSVRDTACK